MDWYGHGDEHVSLSEMDASTKAATGALAVVVAGVVVCFDHVFVYEGHRAFLGGVETVWVEHFGFWVVIFVVVEAPDVDNESCAFGEEVAVYPFIYTIISMVSLESDREDSPASRE